MSTAVKVVLWVLGSVVTLLLLAAGVLWWGLSGGWDGIRPAAQPEDADVVEAREAGHEPLGRLAGPVEAELVQAGSPLGPQSVDECAPGQNNWKTKDGWTLQCTQARVIGVEAPGGSVAGVSTEIDAELRSLGWKPLSYGEMEVLASGDVAEARYGRSDDPDAELVVEVSAPGAARPYLWLGRGVPTWGEGDAQPLLDDLEASPQVTVLASVQRTYFQDD